MNFLDMSLSYHYINNHANIKEANPLLPDRPSLSQFLLQKGVTAPVIAQNMESGQIVIINVLLTGIVLRNHYLYETTPKDCISNNFHVDGHMMPC